MKKSELKQIIREEIKNALREDWQTNAFNAIDQISQATQIKNLLKLYLINPREFKTKISKKDQSIKDIVQSYIDMMKLDKASKKYK